MKVNYDLEMMKIIDSWDKRKKVLLHSCCGPCSSACIERLREYADITILYYNPNIEPKEEYEKRKSEQIRLLENVGIPYLDCDYDNEEWKRITLPLKDEKEGGKRCSVCFGIRLKKTALEAERNGFDYFTTTLTVSPHKNSQLINKIGINLSANYKVDYLPADFKKREGYKRSIELAKQYDLYRQNYCGCLYSKDDDYEE